MINCFLNFRIRSTSSAVHHATLTDDLNPRKRDRHEIKSRPCRGDEEEIARLRESFLNNIIRVCGRACPRFVIYVFESRRSALSRYDFFVYFFFIIH